AGVLLEQPIEFGLEGRVLAGLVPLGGDPVGGGEECVGRNTATESAVGPEGVGHRLVAAHGKSPGRRRRSAACPGVPGRGARAGRPDVVRSYGGAWAARVSAARAPRVWRGWFAWGHHPVRSVSDRAKVCSAPSSLSSRRFPCS